MTEYLHRADLSSRRTFLGTAGAGMCALLSDGSQITGGSTSVAAPPKPHELPKLPYAFDALEPHVDEATMRLHHERHHGGAVKGLNRTEQLLVESYRDGDFSGARQLSSALAYFGSSHVLHSMFWTNMKPDGGGEPQGELGKRIASEFSSLGNFRGAFLASCNSAPASGWGMLAYHPGFDRLVILQVHDHEQQTIWGVEPLLVCDVWEHAYYLKFNNRRADWTTVFYDKLINWDDVAARYGKATARRK